MGKGKLSAILIAVISLIVIITVGILLYMYWPALKGTIDNSKYYTHEDLQNSYNDGYNDGNKSEQELTAKYEYYKNLVDEYTIQVDNLSKEIETLQALVDKFENENTDNKGIIDSLNAQISKLNKTISELEKSIEYYEEFVAGLEQDTKVVATFEYDGSVYEVQVVDKGSKLTITEPEQVDDKIFNGWKVDGVLVDLNTYVINSNTRFVADITFKCKVEFKVDGEIISSQYVLSGENFDIVANPDKEGYVFDCWTVDGLRIENINNYTILSDTTFVANFKQIFKVEFIVDNNVYMTQSVVAGEFVESIANPTSSKGEFLGWTLNGVDIISNITTIAITANTRFVAKFQLPSGKLIDGRSFNSIIKDKATSVVFDKYTGENEYVVNGVNLISGITPINVSVSGNQAASISLYFRASAVYVLSDSPIVFNENCVAMFVVCRDLLFIDFNNVDTSNVTDMNLMFSKCNALTSLDVSSFDTSNVTSMNSMFADCYVLTSLDVSSFDTSNVTSMNSMFANCYSLTSLDISSFDTSNVTEMNSMFERCYALTSLDVSSFDISNVTSTCSMFAYCKNIKSFDLSGFDTIKLNYTSYMFLNCESLQNIYVSGFWDIYNSISSYSMFDGCVKLPNFNDTYTDKTKAHTGAGGYLTLKTL